MPPQRNEPANNNPKSKQNHMKPEQKASPTTTHGADTAMRTFVAMTLCFILALIAYSNSFQCPFHFDDYGNIVGNPNIEMQSLDWESIQNALSGKDRSTQTLSRPVAYLSFALNYHIGQLNVVGYHVVNLIIHLVTGLFIFLWLSAVFRLPLLTNRYASDGYAMALLATALWITHPIHVTAVTYIVQRMAGMASMFYTMAMFFYLKGRVAEEFRSKIGWFAACAMSALLAFGTKENTVVLPITLLLFELILLQGIRKETLTRALRWMIFPFLVICAVALLYVDPFNMLAAYQARPFTLWERVLTQHRVIWHYIGWLLYPNSAHLTLLHDIPLSTSLISPWTTLSAVMGIYGLLGLAVYLLKKRPLISFLILFFFLNHLVEGSILPLELVYEHRNYLPSMAVMALGALLMVKVLNHFSYNKVLYGLVTILVTYILIANAHTTYYRNTFFKNEYTLWMDNIKKYPLLSRPYNNLGKYLNDHGQYLEAALLYDQAIALNNSPLNTDRLLYYENMGLNCFIRKSYDRALHWFNRGLSEGHGLSIQRFNWGIGLVHYRMGRYDQALESLDKALAMDPGDNQVLATKARTLMKLGDTREAFYIARDLLLKMPAWDIPYALMGALFAERRQPNPAIYFWEQFVARNPQDPSGKLALISLYWETGNRRISEKLAAEIIAQKGDLDIRGFVEQIAASPLYVYPPQWEAVGPVLKRIVDGWETVVSIEG